MERLGGARWYRRLFPTRRYRDHGSPSISTLGVALTPIAFFMVALDALVVITALPAIQRDLGAGLSTLEWAVNAYNLAFAAGIVTAAALGDRFGRRRLFVDRPAPVQRRLGCLRAGADRGGS